jgi:CheY-like chemotaxis protein/Tfp pilus assembly protein PilZ
VVARCKVYFEGPLGSVLCDSEDLSEHGLFVRTDELLPVGSRLPIQLTLPDGQVATVAARVVHLLTPSAARAMGRHQGMGLELLPPEPDELADLRDPADTLAEGVDGMLIIGRYLSRFRAETAPPAEATTRALLTVIEPSAPLRARLVRALEGAGFIVDAHPSAIAGLVACEAETPDVLVTAASIGEFDGLAVVQRLALHPVLVDVPVVMLGDDPSDLARLAAYRVGVREYISKPFLDEELIIRVHRLSVIARAADPTTSLRGSLADVSLATLLSLFEFERKSGVLLLMRDGMVARLLVQDGRIIQIELAGPTEAAPALAPRQRVFVVLDWRHGNFEFASCTVSGEDALGESTTTLLLEHARLADESSRRE